METVTLYEKSTCSKCRETKRILDEAGVPYEEVHYYDTLLSKEKIVDLLRKLGMRPHELMRTGEPIYKHLGIKDRVFSDDELVALMAKYPDLIERPVVERGERAVLGRPPEKVKVFLEEA